MMDYFDFPTFYAMQSNRKYIYESYKSDVELTGEISDLRPLRQTCG